MNEHLTLERLSDFVDGALAPDETRQTIAHVEACVRCAGEATRLRGLLAATAALPQSIEPPAELWGEIRATLETNKVVTLPVGRREGWRRALPRSTWAVGATVVIVGTSLLVRHELASPVVEPHPVPAPPAVVRIDRRYTPVLDNLTESLRAKVAVAPAKTAATVNQSIEIVDSAIAETRAALIQDPANDRIAELLSVNYQKKLDLLKRATELATEF